MAAEFVTAAAANTVGKLATEYASPYLSYFFRFGKIVEDFKNRRMELELKNVRVKNDVDEALRRNEVIEKDVEEWLTRVEKELGEAQRLEDEIERNMCFNWSPSWGWRYCLSMKVAKKTLYISQLLAEAFNIQPVGYRAALPGLEFIPFKDFMPSESSNSAFKEIMDALKKDDVNMIGLYGMGGAGKTTLAKEVGNQAKQLFDKVVVATVSQIPDINNIQDQIADFLDLDFEKKTIEGRAEQLWLRIKDEKSILIILDDVWEELDLKFIGIPFGDDHKGCKVFLTTRLQEVCIRMNSQKEVHLNILSENEAWALFKDKAGVEDDSPTLIVAKEVARECNGLPLAIVTVAKALKGRSLNGWIVANRRLRDSRTFDNQDVCGDIYSRLALSYDYLKDDNVKSCFLLCSLFPEDYEINIELLTIFGIGLGLFCNICLIEDLRREIRLALSKLQQSSLLWETDDKKSVKMHNMVCKFAHWITSRGENMFMVKNGLREWPLSGSFGSYVAISLWNIEIANFLNKLEFSKLKILFLTGISKKQPLQVSSNFFDRMEALRVLFLQDSVFLFEEQFLINLQTLCFKDCELKNISSLRNMKRLEIFALFNTNIHELPEELVELRRLKLLYFSCIGPSNVSPNLLTRLASLQELHVTTEENADLLELLCNVKSLTLTDIDMIHTNFFSPSLAQSVTQLQQFKKFTYSKLKDFKFDKEMAELEISLPTLENILEEPTRCASLQSLKNVTIRKCNEVKSLFSPCLTQSLSHAEQLKISQCNKLEQVFTFAQEMAEQEVASLSNLTCLKLSSLPALESIWKEPTHHASLKSLKDIIIHRCHKLKSIFSPCLFGSMLHLEQLEISQCNQLKQVFAFDGEVAELEVALLSKLTCLKLSSLPALESIWKEPTHHASLQSLKDVNVHNCDKLKSIFSPCLFQSMLHLEQLKISQCNQLEQVFAFDREMAKLEVTLLSNLTRLELSSLPALESIWKELTYHASLQSLKDVKIHNCDKLKTIFSPYLFQSLLHLEQFEISECDQLKQVLAVDKEMVELEVPPLSNLIYLELKSLPELRCIWRRSSCSVNLSSLKTMRIQGFSKLVYLFSPIFAQNLKCLEELNIQDCKSFKHLIKEAKNSDEVVSDKDRNLLWPNLKSLEIARCESLKCVFPITLAQRLPKLELLRITDCPQLMHVFDMAKEMDGSDKDRNLLWPNLKSLEIAKCESLKCVFPITLAQQLPKLELLRITDCPQLMHVFDMAKGMDGHEAKETDRDEAKEMDRHDIELPQLKDLRLENLEKLRSFCPKNYFVELPSLKDRLQ